MKNILLLSITLINSFFIAAQNIGINTDGSSAESGVMLDVKGANAKTGALEKVFQIKSNDAIGSEFKLRLILGNNATAGSRYGAISVEDYAGPTYRMLALQPYGGSVGIGTTNPQFVLDATQNQNGYTLVAIRNGSNGGNACSGYICYNDNASSNATFGLTSTTWSFPGYSIFGTNRLFLNANSGTNGMVLNNEGAQPIIFATSFTERMRVDGNGNVGVGTSPSYKLDIASNTTYGGIRINGSADGTGTNAVTNGMLQVRDNDGAAATAYPGGAHITIWPNGTGLGILRFQKSSVSDWNFVDRSTANTNAGRILAIHDADGAGDIMTFWGNGYVGIGNTTPGYKLDVTGDMRQNGGSIYLAGIAGQTVSQLYSYSNANSLWLMQPTTQQFVMADALNWDRAVNFQYTAGTTGNAAGILIIGQLYKNVGTFTHGITAFYTNGAERMRIDNAGNVGIGTTTTTYPLNVNGDASVCGTIRYTSAVGACSDIRYKKDISPLANSLDNVLKLQGVNYFWKTKEFPEKHFTDDKQIGFIAQEIEKIYPEVVLTDKNGYKSVDYSRLTPILVEAIKEQQKVIDELKKENGSQKKEIDALNNKFIGLESMVKTLQLQISTTSEK